MRRLAVLASVLGGCFSPQPPANAPCSLAGTCPSGLSCVANACVAPGTLAIDAPLVGIDATDAPLAIDAPAAPTFTPSNGVDPTLVDNLSATIDIDAPTTIDVDTGAITGAITRDGGTGVHAGIAYTKLPSGIAVFGFANLTVTSTGQVGFTGSRPVVFLVGGTAMISGKIDGTGGTCNGDPACAGPGGGRGAIATGTAGGCAAGRGGVTNPADNSDSGGGGGGGGGQGAAGGAGGDMYPGGVGGASCLPGTLEPLAGGSGGGGGGAGATKASHGGGGGGALQITARGLLKITGTIAMGGGGGEQGFLDPGATTNGSAGGGGGAGGAILLEAPMLTLTPGSVLAANGGGGGGGGFASSNDGFPGAPGGTSTMPAQGGAFGAMGSGAGGNGGAGMTGPTPGQNGNAGSNGGGGGGGVGRIFLRATTTPMPAGLQSPPAGTAKLKP